MCTQIGKTQIAQEELDLKLHLDSSQRLSEELQSQLHTAFDGCD